MKTKIAIILCALLIGISFTMKGQLKFNLEAGLYNQGQEIIYLHSNAQIVNLPEDDSGIIKIDLQVITNIRKNGVLDYIIDTGRYTIVTHKKNDELHLTMPNLRKKITINKKIFKDEVMLIIYLPSNIKLVQYPVSKGELLAVAPKKY